MRIPGFVSKTALLIAVAASVSGCSPALMSDLELLAGIEEFELPIDDRLFAVVNVNTFDATDPVCFTREVTDFDGESAESRLDRRKRTWIPRVTVKFQNA